MRKLLTAALAVMILSTAAIAENGKGKSKKECTKKCTSHKDCPKGQQCSATAHCCR